MSGFRDLQAKLQKIEENYFKDLDIDIQELRRANKDLSADQLVRLARDRFGQEAATYLSNQLEAEYDLADYNASDPQPHLDDMIDNAFADDPYDLDYDKYIKKGIDEAVGRVVEVPPELRGTDPSNEAGATSREAERFLADLGPDDDVSHDVVDPETGELLDWPTKAILKKQDDEEMEDYWRSQGGTKRERGQAKYKADQERDSFDNVPSFYLHSDASGDVQERAYELLDELRNSDFYNVVWRNVGEGFDDEEMRSAARGDYDIDVEMPVLLKRKDGKKLTDDDHDNIKEIIKAVKLASTMGNVGIMYAGATEGGTTARFVPSFM